MEIQQQLAKATAADEARGGGAADVRRWNGLRNVLHARSMLKIVFQSAAHSKAQVTAQGFRANLNNPWLGDVLQGVALREHFLQVGSLFRRGVGCLLGSPALARDRRTPQLRRCLTPSDGALQHE